MLRFSAAKLPWASQSSATELLTALDRGLELSHGNRHAALRGMCQTESVAWKIRFANKRATKSTEDPMFARNMLGVSTAAVVELGQKNQVILYAVEDSLRRSSYLELRRVICSLEEGVLTLNGRVSSYYLRQVAQAIVLGLEGIEAIDNRLEVVTARLGQEKCVGT
jgi:osmotically-inducible protein OsmY